MVNWMEVSDFITLARAHGVTYFKSANLEFRLVDVPKASSSAPTKPASPTELVEEMPPDNEMLFASVEPIEFIDPLKKGG